MNHLSHLAHRRACAALALAMVLAGCGGGTGAVAAPASSPTVRAAWARTTPPGAVDGVAYADVRSPADDELVGVDVAPDVAGGVELHESMSAGAAPGMANMPSMKAGGGAMTMVALDRVALPAGRTVRFEPGGRHLMLTHLAAPLAAGAVFRLAFRFARAPTVEATVEVRDNAP